MRNIAVFTCNRADEGPMRPVVNAIMDLWEARPEQGGTLLFLGPLAGDEEIQEEARREWLEYGHETDCLLVLGDRHELLPICHEALINQIPIAHIHGGETTLGSFDDRVRNAVSQLATIHFTAADMFSLKLESMGIPKDRIFTVGPPGLDDLETDEASEFGSGFFLVCLHPDTTRDSGYNNEMRLALVTALERFPERSVVVIDCNNDPHHEGIRSGLMAFAESTWRNYPRAPIKYVRTIDRRRYLTALKHAAVCIGNSSSFVIEAPALGTPTVLVGDRQKGRPLAASVRSSPPVADAIQAMILHALNVRFYLEPQHLPYGRGGASTKIAEILATWSS